MRYKYNSACSTFSGRPAGSGDTHTHALFFLFLLLPLYLYTYTFLPLDLLLRCTAVYSVRFIRPGHHHCVVVARACEARATNTATTQCPQNITITTATPGTQKRDRHTTINTHVHREGNGQQPSRELDRRDRQRHQGTPPSPPIPAPAGDTTRRPRAQETIGAHIGDEASALEIRGSEVGGRRSRSPEVPEDKAPQ